MTIGDRLREVREGLGYNQTDFAALAGTTKKSQIDYEKNISQPKAGYFAAIAAVGADVAYIVVGTQAGSRPGVPREVGERLIRTMGISAKWLATGEGSMFQTEMEAEVQRRGDFIKEAALLADLEGLTKDERARAHMLVYGLMVKDAAMARDALAQVTEQEMVLIDSYRAATDEGKKAIEATAKALSKENKTGE